ncbi:MAG: HindIII family type II restriction endonuclease [Synergistaceae bacterium]|nr:HindIII family type II restriction endonuclease [Synergistaceae bacterium]
MFNDIIAIINNSGAKTFDELSNELEICINSDKDFIDILRQIGIIPESIAHDSTEEKLFAKASDIVLSRAFRELGLKSIILHERGDSADVIAGSKFFNYTLVADAKAFRLSRTAKNQKDFKIYALSAWKKDNDFAVLCAPYFHYPAKTSQIYSQSLINNVCLLSWEHLIFMIEYGLRENADLNLSEIWNFCDKFAAKVLVSDMKKNFISGFNNFLADFMNLDSKNFIDSLHSQIAAIRQRSKCEKFFWLDEIAKINNYSREQAINELIKSLKIYEKIKQIDSFIRTLS